MQTQFQTFNPSTEETLATYVLLSNRKLEDRVAVAESAQKAWKALDLKERVRVIERVGHLLKDDAEKFAKLMVLEMGKPIDEALAEVKKCASLCSYSASQAERVLRPTVEEIEGASVSVRHEALGVILAIMPWNFPFWQVFRAIIPTLLSGNVVLLKHAMNTPECALAIQEIFEAAIPEIAVLQSLF